MTTEQKVALVEGVWETYGLNSALATVDLPKSTWYYHRNQKKSYQEKYACLLPDLKAIARKHPAYECIGKFNIYSPVNDFEG